MIKSHEELRTTNLQCYPYMHIFYTKILKVVSDPSRGICGARACDERVADGVKHR